MGSINLLLAKVIEENNIDLLVNDVRIVEFEPGYTYGPHSHNSLEVNYIIKGSCFMNVGKESVHYKENDCMILYPHANHLFLVNEQKGCRIIQIDFQIDNFTDLVDEYELKKDLILLYDLVMRSRKFVKLHDAEKIRRCMESIISEKRTKQTMENDLLTRLYFCELFVILSRHIQDTLKIMRPEANKHVTKAIQYINSNYKDVIMVEDIAEQCGISSRYLRKEFKKYLAMSMRDYMIALRISRAVELLSNTSTSVTEIALKTGFSTPQLFSKMFKDKLGMSPTEYRKKLFRKV